MITSEKAGFGNQKHHPSLDEATRLVQWTQPQDPCRKNGHQPTEANPLHLWL